MSKPAPAIPEPREYPALELGSPRGENYCPDTRRNYTDDVIDFEEKGLFPVGAKSFYDSGLPYNIRAGAGDSYLEVPGWRIPRLADGYCDLGYSWSVVEMDVIDARTDPEKPVRMPVLRMDFSFAQWSALVHQMLPPWRRPQGCASIMRNKEWTGTWCYQQALDLLDRGWPSGVRMVQPLKDLILPRVMSKLVADQPVWDVTGDAFDVGMVTTGVHEHWYSLGESEDDGRAHSVAEIFVNLSNNSQVDPKVFNKVGAMVCALIDSLEVSRVQTRVVGYFYCRPSDPDCPTRRHFVTVELKKAGEPVDMGRLAFCLGHPSMLRRLQFRVDELLPLECSMGLSAKRSGTYGHSMSAPRDFFPKEAVVIDGSDLASDCPNRPDKMASWVLDQLSMQGVKVVS